MTQAQLAEARQACCTALLALKSSHRRADRPASDVLSQIISWAMGGDSEELLPLLTEELVLADEDPKAPAWNKEALAPDASFRVLIVGAGMSRLLAGHRL